MTRVGTTRRRRPRLGLFLQGVGYEYQDEIIAGAASECAASDVDLMCFAGGDLGGGTDDHRNGIYSLATPESLDGVVIAAGVMAKTRASREFAELKQRLNGIPIVGLAAILGDTPSVLIENSRCVRHLTEHLIDVHRRERVAFIEGLGAESEARLAGYLEALHSRGLERDPELHAEGKYVEDGGAAAVETWFRSGVRLPDAIVAANDWMALGAIRALTNRGLRVPEDISVVGFDDIAEARFRLPSLTTIRQPSARLGVCGVRTVLRILAGEQVDAVQLLPTVPLIRRSCGCFGGGIGGLLDEQPLAPLARTAPQRWTWARLLHANAPNVVSQLPADWSERLEEALERDLEGGTEVAFASVLERYVAANAQQGNVSAWHNMVLAMVPDPTTPFPNWDPAKHDVRLARVRERAHIVIGMQAERVQGERRLKKEALLRRLSSTSTSVRSAMNHNQLREALLEQLPLLGIQRTFVACTPGGLTPDTPAELLLGYDSEVGEIPESRGVQFRSGELIPEPLETSRRTSTMVIPASFRNSEPLGFFLMEFTEIDGTIFDSLREQLSVALKGIQLLENLVQEATLRGQADRARLEGELSIARKIQSAVLPKNLDVIGLDLATLMVPAAEIGGDYFDVLPFAGGAWLSIGDVAGHGLQAGLEMLMLQSMMAALVEGQPGVDPLVVWSRLNAVLTHNTRSRLATNDHVTLSILRYTADGSVVGVGAHEDIIVHRARTGRCECVPTPGVWAGVMADPPSHVLQLYSLRLEPGDVMILYTDGLTEARNKDHELFGLERLTAEIEAHRTLNAGELCQHLYDVVAEWTEERDDDVSLIVARYSGSPREGKT